MELYANIIEKHKSISQVSIPKWISQINSLHIFFIAYVITNIY